MDCKDLDLYELLGVLSTANIQEVSEWNYVGKMAGLDNSNQMLTCDIDVLTAVFVRIMVFWDVTSCSLVDGYLCLPGTSYPHISSRRVNSKTYSYIPHILHITDVVIRCNVYSSNSVYSSM
jgi:hypothetical protein